MDKPLSDPDITIIVQDNCLEPFKYKEKELRCLFMDTVSNEVILEGNHTGNIPDYDELKKLGPHPLMVPQTYDHPPVRWVHTKLQVAESGEWIRLVKRVDTLYVRGLINERNGEIFCYEISEPPVQGEKGGHRARYFPNAIHLEWDVKYAQLFGCTQAELEQVLKLIASDPNFMTKAIKFLSSHDPTAAENEKKMKWWLAGVIFMLCEFTRMKLSVGTNHLLGKIQLWGDACWKLTQWKDGEYKEWNKEIPLKIWKKMGFPSGRPLNKLDRIGVTCPREALEYVFLVLNRRPDEKEENKPKKSSRKRGGKDEDQDGKSDFGNKPPRSKDDDRDGPSDGSTKPGKDDKDNPSDSKEPPSEDGRDDKDRTVNPIPCGRARLQLLAVRANFSIDAINFFDWHRGQGIYRRQDGQQDGQEDGMDELVLIGPRRAIGAYGIVGVQVFPSATAAEELGITEGAVIFEGWNPCEDIDEIEEYVKVIHIGVRRLELSYLVIPNTIEAEVEVKLRLGALGCYGGCMVSGKIKAWVNDFGDRHVDVFSAQELPLHSGVWNTVPLQLSLVCLPYRPNFELDIEVDLTVTTLSDNSSCSVNFSDLKFSARDGTEVREVNDNAVAVRVRMYPDPVVQAH